MKDKVSDKIMQTHGSGKFKRSEFASLGDGVIFEYGVLVFHPENIMIGDNVYIGHYAIIKGYYRNKMKIGSGTWIGPQCFLHSAAGLTIGNNVGIGPAVKIITSWHVLKDRSIPILHNRLKFSPVIIEDDCDIGTGAIVLPGVRIGKGAQIAAGSVVSRDVKAHTVVTGIPAKVIRIIK
ncbi:MAG: acyltransferase [Candidatus Omnitrophica bacterium]|nr:acyltransferase [Candidatus Omnitrophota bacterium]